MSKQTTINPRTGKRVAVKKAPTPTPNPILPFLNLPHDPYLLEDFCDDGEPRMQCVIQILWARMAAVEKENAELRAFRDEVIAKEESARLRAEEAERDQWFRNETLRNSYGE